MLIVGTYFGDLPRFRPFAEQWLQSVRRHADGAQVRFISDRPGPLLGVECIACSSEPFADCVRPRQSFDVKGALLCDALPRLPANEGVLMIDVDALLLASPWPLLAKFARCPMAMTTDHGALLFVHSATLDGNWSHVLKQNSGVIWFGPSPRRREIPAMYRAAWHELQPVIPWTPKLTHLLEQYAWTLACHRLGVTILPPALNWSTRLLGPCAEVVIDHDYGWGKWGAQPPPVNT
jgi:hypothetical protein